MCKTTKVDKLHDENSIVVTAEESDGASEINHEWRKKGINEK